MAANERTTSMAEKSGESKFKRFIAGVFRNILKNPVELALGVTFFILAILADRHGWNDQGTVLKGWLMPYFFPQFVALSYLLHVIAKMYEEKRGISWNSSAPNGHKLTPPRILYFISYLFFVPFLFVSLSSFYSSASYVISLAVAFFSLFIVTTKVGNGRPFAKSSLNTILNGCIAIFIAGLLLFALLAIYESVIYIFGLKGWPKFDLDLIRFCSILVFPTLFFSMQSGVQIKDVPKFIKIVLDWILSPAVLIYNAILLVYIITILVRFDLPKGNVAYMVMAFYFIALVGAFSQDLLDKHYYDFYYRNFTWFTLAPVILFWVGAIYRTSQYGLTEKRVFLLIAGVLMVVYEVMMLFHSRNYRAMLIIFCSTFIVFCFVPGISARSIAERCQRQEKTEAISADEPAMVESGQAYRIATDERTGVISIIAGRDTVSTGLRLVERDSIGHKRILVYATDSLAIELGPIDPDSIKILPRD
jgi:hypothetical protein